MSAERQFGPYRLMRQIAVGGMAELYLAKTKGIAGFEKYVALKMIHPNFSTDEQFIEMLIDEAKISVQLQHVNIAQTFDLGRVGDTYYITMEFVDGVDLYKLLRRASEKGIQMPLDIAVHIAKEVANGLDYAHRKRDHAGTSLGIVHRDISPQNVLISHSGEVKLIDFGIAKASMKARQTAAGVIKGKYYYMSPEQAWGDPVDHRTDIFSIGILLYESLTGQMLYLEEDLHLLLDMVRKAQIASPRTLRRDIPTRLERIVMNTLQRKREDRYQSAGDMATDLERFLHAHSPVFTPGKVARFFAQIIEAEPPPPVAIVAPVIEEPSMVTMRLEVDDLIRERSELIDENSVIFRVSDLEKKPERARARPSSTGRSAADATRQIPSRPAPDPHSVLDNIEEQTTVSGPPGFGAGPGDAGIAEAVANLTGGSPGVPSFSPSDFPDGGDFEPTMIGTQFDGSGPGGAAGAALAAMTGEVDEEGPTIRRDDKPRELQQLLDNQKSPRQGPGSPAPRASASPVKNKSRGPSNPALVASNPQPAVSALRTPRRPRKTPANIPGQGGNSVLSAIVGKNQDAGAPVRRDAPAEPDSPGPRNQDPAPQGSAPHPSQPFPSPMDHPQNQPGQSGPQPIAMGTGPGAYPPAAGSGAYPQTAGSGAYPQTAGPGGVAPGMHPGPPGSGPQYPIYNSGQPGHPMQGGMQSGPFPGYPRGTDPSYPLPSGSPPATFTRQLQALELEEIPAAYKIGRPQKRWLVPTMLATGCIAVGVIIGIFLFTAEEALPAKTNLRIHSIPGGAKVEIDGNSLPDPTPTEWTEAVPGTQYVLTVSRKGYESETRKVTVGVDGREISFILDRELVSLFVESTPSGAAIFLDNKPKGKTPVTLNGLEVIKSRNLRLELDGYKVYSEDLDWANETRLERTIKLEKAGRR